MGRGSDNYSAKWARQVTDRELLERAARAAGYRPYCDLPWEYDAARGLLLHRVVNDAGDCDGYWWNPLADDGDALRLAVKLNLQITIEDERCGCVTASWGDDYQHHAVEHSETPETAAAATRRVIVRAAVALA